MTLTQAQFYLAEFGRWIENALIAVCGVLLCVMASSVFFEVLIRYVIHAPTAWTEEVAQFVLVWYGLLAAAVGARKGVHFAIRWGVVRFSERTRWIIRQVVNVAVIVFLSALLKIGFDYLDIVANQTSTGSEINMRIPWAGIPVGIPAVRVSFLYCALRVTIAMRTARICRSEGTPGTQPVAGSACTLAADQVPVGDTQVNGNGPSQSGSTPYCAFRLTTSLTTGAGLTRPAVGSRFCVRSTWPVVSTVYATRPVDAACPRLTTTELAEWDVAGLPRNRV
jgi:TRAP-type C4-dicarboxylate transport system permease small subunit